MSFVPIVLKMPFQIHDGVKYITWLNALVQEPLEPYPIAPAQE